jgi:hypothetical protein
MLLRVCYTASGCIQSLVLLCGLARWGRSASDLIQRRVRSGNLIGQRGVCDAQVVQRRLPCRVPISPQRRIGTIAIADLARLMPNSPTVLLIGFVLWDGNRSRYLDNP